MRLMKLLSILILLAIIGYPLLFMMNSAGSPTGNIVATTSDQEVIQILKYPDCMETDRGKDFQVKGSTYNIRDNLIYDDYCNDQETLVEYFCKNSVPHRNFITCDCFKGVCR